MVKVMPFRALRPRPEEAETISAPPYDVLSTEEARAMALGNPLSFLRISKPEIDLPQGTNPYASEVYEKGKGNLTAPILKHLTPLQRAKQPPLPPDSRDMNPIGIDPPHAGMSPRLDQHRVHLLVAA